MGSADRDEKDSQECSHPVNLLKVKSQIMFVHKPEPESVFSATIKLENLSCRYVTYVVRSSEKKKFKIKPRYGCLRPRQVLEVGVKTRDVKNFREISQDFFGVFALPIYDRRQLEKRKLSVLWRAHGTDLFPYSATEFHKIPYIVPKTDDYLADLSISGRITHGSYITRRRPCKPETMDKEDLPVDEETFLLNWPNEGPIEEDSTLNPVLLDWHRVSKKIQKQTLQMQQSYNTILAIFITGATTIFTMSYLYLTDSVPFLVVDENAQKIIPIPEVPAPGPSSWFSRSWLGF